MAAPGQQPPRGRRRPTWRCAAVGLAATAPQPRPRRRTGTRPTGHSREPSDRRHRNLAARRPLDRLTGPSLQAQRTTQQSEGLRVCSRRGVLAAAPRPGRPGRQARLVRAAVNRCAKSNSAAGFDELSLRSVCAHLVFKRTGFWTFCALWTASGLQAPARPAPLPGPCPALYI